MLLIGETHNQLSHLVTQVLVIEKLKNAGANFCVGLEFSHDHIFKAYSKFTEKDWRHWDRNLVDSIKSRDPSGQQALKSMILFQDSVAKYGHQVIWNQLLTNGIASQPNDAAWASLEEASRTDLRDPLTLYYATELFPEGKFTLPLTSKDGLLLRNHMMTDQAQEFALQQDKDIHVQLCGSGHIHGTSRPSRPFSDSLCALYDAQSIPFLAAPLINTDDENNVAADYSLSDENLIKDLALPFTIPKNEEADMNALLHQYGLSRYIIDASKIQRDIKQDFSARFANWEREIQAPTAPNLD